MAHRSQPRRDDASRRTGRHARDAANRRTGRHERDCAEVGNGLRRARRWPARRTMALVSCLSLAVGTTTLSAAASTVAAASPSHLTLRSVRVTPSSVDDEVARAPRLPAGATRIAPVAPGRLLSGVVGLEPRHGAALTAFARAVSTPGSALYHHYLPAGRFAADFGASPSTVATLDRHLRSAGLAVSPVARNGLVVDFRGPARRVAAAFGTSMATYRVNRRVVFANATALRLPAAVAGSVQTVIGLNDLTTPQATPLAPEARGRTGQRAPAAPEVGGEATGPRACPAATKVAGRLGGLTDAAIAHAYGVDGIYRSGDTGGHQTVAVYELEAYAGRDISTFDTCYFGAAAARRMAARLVTVPVDGGDPTGPGSGESELDVEDVSALAPAATLDVYEAPFSNAGYLDEWNAIVTDDTAKIVTSSYGSGCESAEAVAQPGLEQIENSIFEEAAIQGQTILDAAGDEGSEECAYETDSSQPALANIDPASQPYVTSVGGTTIDDASNPPKEQAWNDGDSGAGGGGISSVWPAPSWQSASRVPGIDRTAVVDEAETVSGGHFCQTASVRTACRELPDVSAQADEYTGAVTVYEQGRWGTIGGTSSSTPLWAAMLADVDSTKACSEKGGLGFVDPALYALASVPSEYRASFNDVTVSNNDAFGASDGLYPATPGYDMATGLGSPRITGPGGGRGLAYYLCAPTASSRPTVTAVAPAVVSSAAGSGIGTAGSPVTLVVTGTGFSHNGVPDVAGVTVGTDDVDSFSVDGPTSLSLRLPPGAVQEGAGTVGDGGGTYDVSVTLVGGESSRPSSAARLVVTDDPTGSGASLPVVGAVDPSGGAEAGGTSIRIYGSGFTAGGGATGVTVGGVPASFTAVSDREIVATVPAYASSGTACAFDGDDPTTDVCQSEVRVTTGSGPSAESTILPELSSDTAPTSPAETTAAPTEFDYLPAPHVSGVVFDPVTPAVASESGQSVVTVNGSGFGLLGLEWVDVGAPGEESSVDAEIIAATPTSLTIGLPAISSTAKATVRRLAVQTLASPNLAAQASGMEPSNVVRLTYAPQPEVTAVTTPSGKRLGPDHGGTPLTVTGTGFEDGVYVGFEDNEGGASLGTQYDVTASKGATMLRLVTPAEIAGADQVLVCNVSGCSGEQTFCEDGFCITFGGSTANPRDVFSFYPPGAPRLTRIFPKNGPAGSLVTITGVNLDLPQAVYFGAVRSPDFANAFNFQTFSSEPDVVIAVVPRGLIGKKVDVRVVTAESLARRRSPKTPIDKKVTFTFTKPRRHQMA